MKRLLGVDHGEARIGLAISDELQMLAHPCATIVLAKTPDSLGQIAAIARDKNVERIVVGLPRHMNGSLGASAEKAQAFAEKLRAATACDVVTWDERLSTVAAHRALRDAGKSTRQTRDYVDQVAAQMLLQSYLDHQQLSIPDVERDPRL